MREKRSIESSIVYVSRLGCGARSKCGHLLVDHDDPEKRVSELERQLVPEPGLSREPSFGQVGLRRRSRLARGMVKLTDPDGVQ